nr:Multidrug resistance protein MdtF [Klebsiella pneumoniae]
MSKFFIHRPVFARVLAIIMMIAGGPPSCSCR